MMKQTMRQTLLAATLIAGTFGAAIATSPAAAQGLFSPVIRVNDQVINRYEIDQRATFLELINVPGDPVEVAREQLVEDRLKMLAARRFGFKLNDVDLQNGLAEFAGRANLKPDVFLQEIAKEGVDKETVLYYIEVQLTWREIIRGRFGPRVSVTEADIDKAMDALGSRAAVQVLLSEVIIPLQAGYEEQIKEIADQVALIDNFTDFAAAAKQYSAAATRDQGGKLGWLPINRLPEPLRPVLLGLEPGETSAVIPMQGALAIFQMRSIAETAYRAPRIAAVEYASYRLPGGRTPENLVKAAKIAGELDTCDDLYGTNFGQADALLDRVTAAPADLPRNIAVELAKLDDNEVSYTLTANEGQDLLMLMLCGRSAELGEDASREQVSLQLRTQQLESFAQGYLEELRSEARIYEK